MMELTIKELFKLAPVADPLHLFIITVLIAAFVLLSKVHYQVMHLDELKIELAANRRFHRSAAVYFVDKHTPDAKVKALLHTYAFYFYKLQLELL